MAGFAANRTDRALRLMSPPSSVWYDTQAGPQNADISKLKREMEIKKDCVEVQR